MRRLSPGDGNLQDPVQTERRARQSVTAFVVMKRGFYERRVRAAADAGRRFGSSASPGGGRSAGCRRRRPRRHADTHQTLIYDRSVDNEDAAASLLSVVVAVSSSPRGCPCRWGAGTAGPAAAAIPPRRSCLSRALSIIAITQGVGAMHLPPLRRAPSGCCWRCHHCRPPPLRQGHQPACSHRPASTFPRLRARCCRSSTCGSPGGSPGGSPVGCPQGGPPRGARPPGKAAGSSACRGARSTAQGCSPACGTRMRRRVRARYSVSLQSRRRHPEAGACQKENRAKSDPPRG